MDITEATALLSAARSLVRDGYVDGYSQARLAQHGYTLEQAQRAAEFLVSALPLAAVLKEATNGADAAQNRVGARPRT